MSFPLIEFQEYSRKFQQLTLNNNNNSPHHHHRSLHFHCRLVTKEDYNIAAINNNDEDDSSSSRFVSVSLIILFIITSPAAAALLPHSLLGSFSLRFQLSTHTLAFSHSHTLSFHSISTRRENDSFQSSSWKNRSLSSIEIPICSLLRS